MRNPPALAAAGEVRAQQARLEALLHLPVRPAADQDFAAFRRATEEERRVVGLLSEPARRVDELVAAACDRLAALAAEALAAAEAAFRPPPPDQPAT
jgi:hypothetical protein